MRDQYAGDISDFFKFSFLRALASKADIKLGIGWYFVDVHDGRADGKNQEYLSNEQFACLDPELFKILATLPDRSVAALQNINIWPAQTIFHSSPLPPSQDRRDRDAWSWDMATTLSTCDLVFVDPDNSVSFGDSVSERHASINEIETLAAHGRPVVFIKFPGRQKYVDQISDIERQFTRFKPITLTTSTSVPTAHGGKVPRARWFVVLNSTKEIRQRTREFSEQLHAIPDITSSLHEAK
jgi:hypothetical protein